MIVMQQLMLSAAITEAQIILTFICQVQALYVRRMCTPAEDGTFWIDVLAMEHQRHSNMQTRQCPGGSILPLPIHNFPMPDYSGENADNSMIS